MYLVFKVNSTNFFMSLWKKKFKNEMKKIKTDRDCENCFQGKLFFVYFWTIINFMCVWNVKKLITAENVCFGDIFLTLLFNFENDFFLFYYSFFLFWVINFRKISFYFPYWFIYGGVWCNFSSFEFCPFGWEHVCM